MTTQNAHHDQIYIDGLLQNNTEIIINIYKTFVPKVKNYIKKNNGSFTQADDVVQDVLINLYNQAHTAGLQLTCPFDAYFFLLCKRKWLNELKKVNHKMVTINDEKVSINDALHEQLRETEQFDKKQALFDELFLKLGAKCQELLRLSFTAKTLTEVAVQLNVTYGYVRKKKSICTAQLTTMIQQSHRFEQAKTDN